jgi:hypothetical protein
LDKEQEIARINRKIECLEPLRKAEENGMATFPTTDMMMAEYVERLMELEGI